MSALWNIVETQEAKVIYCRKQIRKMQHPRNGMEERMLVFYKKQEEKYKRSAK